MSLHLHGRLDLFPSLCCEITNRLAFPLHPEHGLSIPAYHTKPVTHITECIW
jgi:hypothetical protein